MSAQRCPYCGRVGEVVRVHGHGQCPHCGTNIEPCCAGANALGEAATEGTARPAHDIVTTSSSSISACSRRWIAISVPADELGQLPQAPW